MTGLALLVPGGAIISGPGCASADARAPRDNVLFLHERLRERTLAEFGSAVLWKPRGRSISDLEMDLAPLIVQEHINHGADASGFGPVVDLDGHRNGRVDATPPTVYVTTRLAQIHGIEHEQVEYCWAYPAEARGQGHGEVISHCVCMTLHLDGFPMVLRVRTWGDAHRKGFEPDVLFVSDALEREAAEEYGAPLPGRRYAIERSVSETPDSVVVRVIEDGPIPMGPYVYLEAETHDITTLLCRCSPSQVDRFVESVYYDLLEADAQGAGEESAEVARSGVTSDRGTQGPLPIRPLTDVLRWPSAVQRKQPSPVRGQ